MKYSFFQLIVGSDDHDIRVFKEDAIDYELSETEAITCLCAINKHTFAYSLSNGTVGVYFHKERLWRIKSKNQAISLLSYDINNDGSKELITGWSNGKVDVRNVESGEVLYKDNLSKSIAAVLIADYNLDGINELIVCTVEGKDNFRFRFNFNFHFHFLFPFQIFLSRKHAAC